MSLRPASSRRRFGVLRAAAAAAFAVPLFAFFATAASAITALSPFTASVASPTAGTTVTGVTTLVARVSDTASSGHFSISMLTGAGGLVSVAAAQDAVDPGTWSASWDSTAAANGSYSVTFNAVRSSDGTPSESAAVLFSVDNAPPALTVSVTAPAALATLTGAAGLQASTNVAADSLTFVITPMTGGSPVTALASGRSGNTSWAAAWDSTAVPNGSYGIVARAFQGGSFTDSLSVAVNVQNAVVAPALAVSIGTPVSGAAVTGIITIAAATNVVASSVTFAIRDGAGVLAATLPATSADGLAWTAIWDTTGVANGSFKLRAHAAQDGTSADSTATDLTVSNVAVTPPVVEPMAVTLLAPSAGATVLGTVPLSAQTNVAAESLVFVITKNFGDRAVSNAPATGNGTSWTGIWDAGLLPNGSYAIAAKATKSGTDTLSAAVNVTLSNPVNADGGGGGTTTTPLVTTIVSPSAGVTLSGTATLIAGTNVAADSLVFVLRDPLNPDAAPAASATATAGAGNTAWTASINTATVANGTYALVARAVKAGTATPSAPTSVTVLNAASGGATEPVAFTVTLPVAGARLSGTVSLSATANQPVDGFTFLVESATAAAHQTIAATGNGVKTVWTAAWDTTSLPNGDYTMQTVAVKGGIETHGSPVAFSVANANVSVTLTTPPSGASLAGTVEILVAAVPSATGVSIRIASAADAAVTSTRTAVFDAGRQVWAVQWNTVDFPNGGWRLEAKATSADGHEFFATPVSVTVANAAPPSDDGTLSVRITSPSSGAAVSGLVTIAASVVGTAAGVQFFIGPATGGSIIRVDAHFDAASGRWIGTWKSTDTSNGDASIGAVAVNGQNVHVESAKVGVTVRNAVPEPVPEQAPFSVALTEPTGGNVSGVVHFLARTEGVAAEVKIVIRLRSAAQEPRALPASFDAAQGAWTATWDTAASEIGTYDAVAVAKNAAGAQTTSPNVVTLFLERREPEGGPAPVPPAETPSIAIVRPLPDAALHGIAVLAARVSGAEKVVFVVRAADGTEIARRDAVKGETAWTALWDTSRAANGRYAVEGLALDLSGNTTSSAHVVVLVENGTGEPVSSIDVVPQETAIAAVRDVPSGSVALRLEKLPQDVAAAREKLSEECAAARIPAERCAQWLAMRHQSSDCRDAGIVTKEECVSFLEDKHGGAMPDCAGGERACAEAVAKATAGLLGADELRGIRDAITPHIGQVFRIVPRGERPAAQEPGTPSAQPGGAGEPPQIIDDLIPLVSDRPFAVRVHASPGFGMAAGNLRHDSVPAVLFLDSDEDGLPDDVERRIGTDPMNKDTDGDGYDDGTELRGGYNPRGKGRLADGVKNLAPIDVAIASGALIEQPTNAGDVSPELVVTAAETRSGLPADSAGGEAAAAGGASALHLSGRAKPGQVVTIFVYSYLPVVLTTEANDDGTWSYDLDSGLSDGQHEVYATVTDETGKIQGKSNPLSFFVSEAKAVTEDQFFKPEELSPLAAAAVQEPVRQLAGWYLGGAALLIVVALVIAYFLFMKPKKTLPPPRP